MELFVLFLHNFLVGASLFLFPLKPQIQIFNLVT